MALFGISYVSLLGYPQPLNDKHCNWLAPMILRQRYFYNQDAERRKLQECQEKAGAEQFIAAAAAPTKFKSRLHRFAVSGAHSPERRRGVRTAKGGYNFSQIFSSAQIRQWEDSYNQGKAIFPYLEQDDAQEPSGVESETYAISWRGSPSTMGRRTPLNKHISRISYKCGFLNLVTEVH